MLLLIFICLAPSWAHATPPVDTVFLAGSLSDEAKITLTAAHVAASQPGVVLFDSAETTPYLRAFLKDYQGALLQPVGTFSEGKTALAQKFGVPVDDIQPWGRHCALWDRFFPKAAKVVICPPHPRSQLLQAACLAGVLQAPLLITSGTGAESARLLRRLRTWETSEIYAVGTTPAFWKGLASAPAHRLKDEQAVQASCLRHALKKGPLQAFVVANPFDTATGKGGISTLAPWIALQKRGLLLLTNQAGDNVKALIGKAIQDPKLRAVDALLLAGNLQALPAEKRGNPLEGKDQFVEVEPGTPQGSEPVTFATGRVFHGDHAVVARMLARPQRWKKDPAVAYQALVVSNPGGGLPLLETFSRTTAKELANAGYQVSAFFNEDANRPAVRAALPQQTIFLWEGHHSTLVRDYEVHTWPEPLRPSVIFLQSCLALAEPKAFPFLQRGAVAVLGSSTRTYSGSGGALSLSYFDALLYEKQSLGGSLRHAKNFLLCFAQLKEKRLGEDTKLTGANLRSAWAFSLWGDPTLCPPLPPTRAEMLDSITHKLRGNTLTIALPQDTHGKIVSAKYRAEALPNARLAGLLTHTDQKDDHPLVPLIFREIKFSKAPPDKMPHLRGRLPEGNWVFLYDQRRAVGYLLVRPRSKDLEEIRFTVDWE